MTIADNMRNTTTAPIVTSMTEEVATNSFLLFIMSHYSLQQWAKGLALFSGVFFVICFFWSFILTDPTLYEFHMSSLRMTFPGFSGMNPMSFIIGLIEGIILGLAVGWGLAYSLNFFEKS
jgi:hypothetical protein